MCGDGGVWQDDIYATVKLAFAPEEDAAIRGQSRSSRVEGTIWMQYRHQGLYQLQEGDGELQFGSQRCHCDVVESLQHQD